MGTTTSGTDIRLAEETIRALAAAAGSARLYPAGSPMTASAVDRFVHAAAALTAAGPVRFTVDPKGLRLGDQPVGDGLATAVTLAETLYAQQAGQLLVAPGVGQAETAALIRTIGSDPVDVRSAGGLRSALAAAGVSHLGVVEVTLRTSEEQGLLGLDLTLAPGAEVARGVVDAAEHWRTTAAAGEGADIVAAAIQGLDAATLAVAEARTASALLLLTERERVAVLEAALTRDVTGKPMEGTLQIVSRMSPAALARLLAMFSGGSNERLSAALAALRIPPGAAEALQTLLQQPPEASGVGGTPDHLDPAALAAEAIAEEPGEAVVRWRLVNSATPQDASARALEATLAVLRSRPQRDSVAASGIALAGAMDVGAWRAAARGAAELDHFTTNHPPLSADVAQARAALADPTALTRACEAAAIDTPGAADVVALSGRPAADCLVAVYAHTADRAARARLAAISNRLGDAVPIAASRMLKDADSVSAVAAIELLAAGRAHGAGAAIARALDNVDPQVRVCALRALSACADPDSFRMLLKAMSHWDPATRRVAARELGELGSEEAVDPLVKVLWDRQLFERNYELRKQTITSLVTIGSPRALPGLRRMAGWRFVMDRRGRELRFLARQAVTEIEARPAAPLRSEGKVRS
jgi:hypothetical protein